MTPDREDMRIEIIKRELDQGVLAGFGAKATNHAAMLILSALDNFEADADQRAYASGFSQGVAFQKTRSADALTLVGWMTPQGFIAWKPTESPPSPEFSRRVFAEKEPMDSERIETPEPGTGADT